MTFTSLKLIKIDENLTCVLVQPCTKSSVWSEECPSPEGQSERLLETRDRRSVRPVRSGRESRQ